MAFVEIHAVKTTLNRAIDYIMDAQKTDGKTLVDSFGVTPETAALEFKITEKIAMRMKKASAKKEKNLAYHVVQSFDKKDQLTPEKALEIGRQFADEFLQGKYEYVIATHTDKAHIHNHIIFNATSCQDYRKFNCHKKIPMVLQGISNKLCAQNDLAIMVGGHSKVGKSYANWLNKETGLSWKATLKKNIDNAIATAKSYEDFLVLMTQKGYEFKRQNGKVAAFKHQEQKQFTWLDKLDEAYQEVGILRRIEEALAVVSAEKSLVARIEIKAKSDQRYSDKDSIKKLAETISFLQANEITSVDELRVKADEIIGQMEQLNQTMRSLDIKLQGYKEVVALIRVYSELKGVAEGYKSAIIKKTYKAKHAEELAEYEIAIKKLAQLGLDPERVPLEAAEQMYAKLEAERKALYQDYRQTKEQLYLANRSDQIIGELLSEKISNAEKER